MPFDFTDPRLYRPRAALYALAFEEAGRALGVQRQLLTDLRSRAAGVVAGAALTASIFGGAPVGHGTASYVAVLAFLGVGGSTLGLFWMGHLEMMVDPEVLLQQYAEPTLVPIALVHRDLALHAARSVGRNQRTLERMTALLRVAVASLAFEVVAWVVNYAQTL